jgi:hypothetical protein
MHMANRKNTKINGNRIAHQNTELKTLRCVIDLWVRVWVMVFNATFNNIVAILWQSVLLMEEPEYRRKPPTCRKSLTSFNT